MKTFKTIIIGGDIGEKTKLEKVSWFIIMLGLIWLLYFPFVIQYVQEPGYYPEAWVLLANILYILYSLYILIRIYGYWVRTKNKKMVVVFSGSIY